jgi:hypothetical protein
VWYFLTLHFLLYLVSNTFCKYACMCTAYCQYWVLEDHFSFCKYFSLYCEIAPWVNKVIIIIIIINRRQTGANSPIFPCQGTSCSKVI